MHAEEIAVDEELVRRLLTEQFPQWADLPLSRVEPSGTDNAIFRLGEDLAVRVPRIPGAARQALKEQRWLPLVAPVLPLAVPVPVGIGVPGQGYPWPWSVCPWLAGEPVAIAPFRDPVAEARSLAGFVAAMRAVELNGGPGPGDHNFGRGRPLGHRDGFVQEALARLHGVVDVAAAADSWAESLHAPVWDGAPRWIHGDLHETNVLVADGCLSAVIDFGGLGVGDPACDVMAAWTVFDGAGRQAFREALDVDDSMWLRGRGWALSMGLIALPYYLDTSPAIAAQSRGWVESVLGDRAG